MPMDKEISTQELLLWVFVTFTACLVVTSRQCLSSALPVETYDFGECISHTASHLRVYPVPHGPLVSATMSFLNYLYEVATSTTQV